MGGGIGCMANTEGARYASCNNSSELTADEEGNLFPQMYLIISSPFFYFSFPEYKDEFLCP
jgi:hypothetical protein